MRESLGFARVVSVVDLVARGRFPSRAAVSGLAGVTSPVGLTHFDHDVDWVGPVDSPESMTSPPPSANYPD